MRIGILYNILFTCIITYNGGKYTLSEHHCYLADFYQVKYLKQATKCIKTPQDRELERIYFWKYTNLERACNVKNKKR